MSRQDHDRAEQISAEQIVDAVAEQFAEQWREATRTPAETVEAVRQYSKAVLRRAGIEIPDDDFERLVREMCEFNFITAAEGES